MQIVADERGQKAGGAEAPMGASDGGDGIDPGVVVEETPPPPLTCVSMKPGSSRCPCRS
jgi:hypothetical protein